MSRNPFVRLFPPSLFSWLPYVGGGTFIEWTADPLNAWDRRSNFCAGKFSEVRKSECSIGIRREQADRGGGRQPERVDVFDAVCVVIQGVAVDVCASNRRDTRHPDTYRAAHALLVGPHCDHHLEPIKDGIERDGSSGGRCGRRLIVAGHVLRYLSSCRSLLGGQFCMRFTSPEEPREVASNRFHHCA